MQETLANYQNANPAIGGDPRKLNLASLANDDCKASCAWTRTLTGAANKPVTWTATASGSSRFSLSVQPSSFTLTPGLLGPGTQAITVSASNTGLVPGTWEFGSLTLTPSDASIPAARFPVAVKTKGGNVLPACDIPFTTVVTDAAEPTTIQAQHDVREVAVAGLFPTFAGQATPNVTFRLKVATLDPLPAESFWQVTFVPPGTPAGTSYFVRMAQGPSGDPSFTYGTIVGTSFTTLGAPESGTWTRDGKIAITIAASKIGNVTSGGTITSIAGAAGYGHPGVFTSGRDSTSAGSYTLRTCEDTGPIANADTATTTERTPVVINVVANDASPSGSPLTVTAVTQPANGSSRNNNNGTVTYTPNVGFNGADSFTYTISDAQGRTASATVTVRVAPFCPTTGKAYDFETGAAGWTVDTAENEFTASPNWAVTPDPLAKSGLYSFTTNDPNWTKDDRLVAPPVDVTSVGIVSFWHRYGTEDGFDGGVLEVSRDGGTTWTDVVAAGGVFLKGGYNGSISSTDGSAIAGRKAWTGGNATGAMTEVVVDVGALAGQGVQFRWRFASDGLVPGVGWWIDDVALTGLATTCNEPPVAVNDAAVTEEGTAVRIAVLGNDSDPDGDALTVGRVSDPANGTATVNPDNTVTYTPDPGFVGTDTFTYTAFDGEWEDTATVTVTVEKRPNTAPVASADTATTPRNTAVIIPVLANDTDADGDALTLTGVTQPSSGTASANADGTVTYTPAINFNGTVSFTYSIADGHGGTATGGVTVTVGQPGAPVACFTTSPKHPIANGNTSFSAKCTTDDKAADEQLTYVWDFQSDGVADATGMKAHHTYPTAGTFRVTLRVTDPDGNTDVLVRDLEVRPN